MMHDPQLAGRLRRCVVTVCMGSFAEQMAEISHPRLHAYATRIGAEFVVLRTAPVDCPFYARYQIHGLLNDYERVISIDSDMLVAGDCPDLFKLVPEDHLGAFVEGRYHDRQPYIDKIQARYGDIGWRNFYFNAGLLVVSRGQREIYNFDHGRYDGDEFTDQTQINFNVQKLGIKVFDVGRQFNYFAAVVDHNRLRRSPGRFSANIIHYAGMPRMPQQRLRLMRGDFWIFDRLIDPHRVPRRVVVAAATLSESLRRMLRWRLPDRCAQLPPEVA